MNNRLSYAALSMALFSAAGTGLAQPEPTTKDFVSFKAFLANTSSASPVDFTRTGSRVKDDAAFGEMRQHILTMYRGVDVTHSFVLQNSHFDCIPIAQQPTVKAFGIKNIATAPPQASHTGPPTAGDAQDQASPASQLSSGKKTDEFGNAVGCEEGTIPMRRITLEEMTRFPTLHDFFQKGPGGAGRPAKSKSQDDPSSSASGHKYSLMYQEVDNLGGNANLNLWSPYVNTAWGEGFSLSQEWYVGGSGSSTQTVEVGWQNYPDKYGSEEARLFIFWTADDYNQTGCYNLDCAAFVQVNNSVPLGGGFTAYSTFRGPQYEIGAKYLLYQGNWWVAIQGTWVGYYPGYLYGGGQLAYNAQLIEFGTESVGVTVWPGEGSGFWSTSEFGAAAYQRDLYYFDLAGGAIWDSLTPSDPSPRCYSTSGPDYSSSSGWGVYFYEGGPGGPGC